MVCLCVPGIVCGMCSVYLCVSDYYCDEDMEAAPSHLNDGDMCCVLSTEDNLWYRAQVSAGHLVQDAGQWGSFGTGQRSVGVIWYSARVSGGHLVQGKGQWGSFGTAQGSVGVIWYRAKVSGGHLVQGTGQWGSFGTGHRSVGVIWYRA